MTYQTSTDGLGSKNREAARARRSRRFDNMGRPRNNAGQTAIIAVITLTLVVTLIGVVLVSTVMQSLPLQQATAVSVYANRALEAGENAYVTALNANPSLAQCNSSTNGAGTCSGINYAEWNQVNGSTASGADAEYYAFGNPQPTFDPTTHALADLAVQVVGAALDKGTNNHYLFTSATMHLAATNGFLTGIWWSNYESYSSTGNYANCHYNWRGYAGPGSGCTPVYFAANDYVFGPTYTNDSVYVSGSSPATATGSPSFGTATSKSVVQTADPNCLFINSSFTSTNCTNVKNSVYAYAPENSPVSCDSSHSCHGHAVEAPPVSDASLGVLAAQNGCLYSGPTKITFSTQANGVGQMTVSSPETTESTQIIKGQSVTWDTANIPTNANNCPNNGTAPLPANGVVFVQNASPSASIAGTNPFDSSVYNSVTNLAASPATPVSGSPVTLTATVTSASNQLANGATVTFSQASRALSQCTNVAMSAASPVVPATKPRTYTSSATCSLASSGTGTYSATYNANSAYITTSQTNLGQNNVLSSTVTNGPNAQTIPSCNACYYGATSSPDIEGDAFVQGNLSGQVTVGTANDVIITGNLTYADCQWTTGQSGLSTPSLGFCPYNTSSTNDALGLIANAYVDVNHPIVPGSTTLLPACTSVGQVICDPSNGTSGLTIDAAVLALTQSFVVDNYQDGPSQGNLYNYGSIQQFARGPVGTFSGSTSVSGYVKHYNWSPLLDFVNPPSYLTPSTPSWELTSIDTNAGVRSTNQCPPLLPIYGSNQPVTQYCNAAVGGLPTYPTSTVPSAPTNVEVQANADGTATVTWNAPQSNGDSPILSYGIAVNPSCSSCTGLTSTSTSTVVTGLSPGVYYDFSVAATNANGTGDPSYPSSAVAVPAVPGASTLVSAVANANGSVSVNWTPPQSAGSPVNLYTIIPSPACSSCTGLTSTSPATVISGLTVGSTYTFTVVATNSLGAGAASAPSNPVTIPTVPGAPVNVVATSNANGQSVVSWTAPASNGGSPITGYTVTSSPGSFICTTSGTTSCAVTGLTNGSSYAFTVVATNVIGTGTASAASNAATPSTVPGAPTSVSATANNSSATVSWTAPANNGGSPVTGYTVTSDTGQTCTTSGTSCTVNGLTNGSTYRFTVVATNLSGNSLPSASSNAITPTTLTGAPSNVAAASYQNSQATVSWSASANNGATITGYQVTASPGSGSCTAAASARSCVVTGLANGTTYTFSVVATSSLGNSPSASATATPATVPGTATGLSTTVTTTSITVTWSAPGSNGGAAVTGYTAVASPGDQTCTATTSPCTITGLSAGTLYVVTVFATNLAGTGAGATTTAATSAAPSGVPGQPTNVGASVGISGSATVSWTVPASNGGSAITGYTVQYATGGSYTNWTTASGCTGTGTTCTINGLTNGTSYKFQVLATNPAGSGPYSAASSAVTVTSTNFFGTSAPNAPTNVVATNYQNGQVPVSWLPPTSNGGLAITGYTVQYATGSGYTNWTTASGCTGTSTSCVVSPLTNGTSYEFRVLATNSKGSSSYSTASNAATPATTPGAPTAVSASNVNNVANGTAPSASVSWTAPTTTNGSAISGYAITAYIGSNAQATESFSSTATTETFTGLTAGTTYTFTVAAINGAGNGSASAASNSVNAATVASSPIGVTATPGNASAIITWTASANTGGASISGYSVTSTPAVTAPVSCTNTSNLSCTFTGLTNGIAYTFAVTAVNAAGSSAAGASASTTPFTLPGAPTGVAATSHANSQSLVSWTAPASNGSAITGYTVTATDSTTSANGGQTCATATTSCLVTGLTNGDSYTFTVTATNAAGTGASSAASAAAVPSTVPGAPTITNVVGGAGAATVTWTAPVSTGGAAVTGYTVTSSTGGFTCTTSSLTCTVNGLTNGTTYTFTVTATNASGTGLPSANSAAVTPATVPGPPTAVAATSNANGQSTITWTDPASNGGSAITGYTATSSPGGSTCTATGAFANTCTVTGLTNGTAYTFTVTATNAIGTSNASAPSPAATPASVPGAPGGVSASSNQNSESTVSWSAPASNGGIAITSYIVSAIVGGTVQATQTFTGTSTSGIVVGLVNGTTYTFTVQAVNAVGTGPASTPSAPATPGATPSAPTSVLAQSFQNGSSTISWTAPNANGSPITGYTVTSAPGGSSCTTTGATTCVVTGLTNGTGYTFTVTATNAIGAGPASAPSNTATPSTVPGAPTGITVTAVGPSQATLSWTAPANNGGAAVTGYTVTSSPGGITCVTSTTSCTVTGLVNGNSYTFTVTANNPSGTGPASTPSSAVVPATTPDAPTGVVASVNSGTAFGGQPPVTVTWTDPVFNGGSAITSYTVTSAPAGGTCTVSGAAATTCTISTGLTLGTSYTFTVKATNVIGSSAASTASNAVAPATVPSAPTSVTAVVTASTPNGPTGSVTVSWAAPSSGGSAITGYTVTSSTGGFTCTTTGATTCNVTGLSTGSSYTFTVKAANAEGTSLASTASGSVTVSTVPGAPTGVVAVNAANTPNGTAVATISWTAPASTGGASISRYTVTSSPGGLTCTTTGTTTCNVSGLTAGGSYTFTVTATNANGVSTASAASSPLTAYTVPGAPTGVNGGNVLNVANGSTGSATISWTAPGSTGGSSITGYSVTSSPVVTPPVGCTNTASTSCTFTGLAAGTTYTFTVKAINGDGSSLSSAASSGVLVATVPGAPTAVSAVNVANTPNGSTGSATISWTAPASNGGSSITGYTVTSTPGNLTCSPSSGTSCSISGLAVGTSYTFTVVATNAAGNSLAGTSGSVSPTTVPSAPTGVTATNQANTPNGTAVATISWTAPASSGGSPITGYTVTSSSGSRTCTTATTSCNVTGLTAGSAYTFTVTATNGNGTGVASAASNSVTVATVPGAPTGVGASNQANTPNGTAVAAISWTAPASTGGSSITGYTVTSTSGGFSCTTTGATTCNVSGLAAGSSYTFTVTATNGDGTSVASAASTAVTVFTVPGAPTGVGASNRANTPNGTAVATVTWTAPASNGGSGITSYTVTPYLNGTTAGAAQSFSSSPATVTGLAAGSAYTFTVTATNGDGTSTASSASTSITVSTLPAAPAAPGAANVAGVANASAPSATITWVAPNTGGSSITGYSVTSSPVVTPPAGCTNTSNLTCTFTGLAAGISYTFTVTATNANGTSPASPTSTPMTAATVPGAPTGVAAAATASNTSATVSWTTPASTGGSPIQGYTVTSSPGGKTCTTSGNSCAVSGLTTKTSYTFTVTAYNQPGTGLASTASNALVVGTPGSPNGITATNVANVANGSAPSATVSWTAPSANGGATVTGYTVTSSPSVTAPAACTNTANLTCTFTGLAAGTTYTFSVVAINTNGSGVAGTSASVTAYTLTNAPTGVTATGYQNTQAPVSWNAPSNLGGGSISKYTVTATDTTNSLNGGETCTTSTTSCTATGLTNGDSYTFTVTATNQAGTSPASGASTAVIPATAPDAPTGVVATATATTTSTTVSWSAPANNGGANVTGYTVTASPSATAPAACVNTANLTCTFTGLTAKTSYTFTVTATNPAGTSVASAASAAITQGAPNAPTGVTAAATASNTSATISWTAPAINGGSSITGYTVTSSPGGKTCTTTGTTSCTVAGLTTRTAYTFTVTAANTNGTSPASAPSNAITVGTPGSPTGVTAAVTNASGAILVTWADPANNGGASVTSYTVNYASGGTVGSQACTANTGTSTSCTVTGLTKGTSYSFTVIAVNSNGNGVPSAVSNSAIASYPGTPTIGTATASTFRAGQVTVAWTDPSGNGGSAITGYVVTPYLNGTTAQTTQTFTGATATSGTLTGLNSGAAYTFTVSATNGNGTGSESAQSNQVTTK